LGTPSTVSFSNCHAKSDDIPTQPFSTINFKGLGIINRKPKTQFANCHTNARTYLAVRSKMSGRMVSEVSEGW
jgi:hypothetical protein